ncbi:MAG: hypothetical protein JWR01_15 [Subtercola sp.]|nr:hypothetical protein [Subtercola sp.]
MKGTTNGAVRRRMTLSLTVLGAVVVLGLVGVGAGVFGPGHPPAETSASETTAPPSPNAPDAPDSQNAPNANFAGETALAVLSTLDVKGRAPKTGYQRTAQFGEAWLDVDRNGCDTRNDILARDLAGVVRSGSCKVLSGVLVDRYTGTTIDFVRGNTTSTLVQIDHVVALSDAWQTGAQLLTESERISLANDPLNLWATDGATNQQKGDGDAATWLPPAKGFRCEYAARQISVKATYGLWVTQAEHDALAGILASCPDQPSVSSTLAPAAGGR